MHSEVAMILPIYMCVCGCVCVDVCVCVCVDVCVCIALWFPLKYGFNGK